MSEFRIHYSYAEDVNIVFTAKRRRLGTCSVLTCYRKE